MTSTDDNGSARMVERFSRPHASLHTQLMSGTPKSQKLHVVPHVSGLVPYNIASTIAQVWLCLHLDNLHLQLDGCQAYRHDDQKFIAQEALPSGNQNPRSLWWYRQAQGKQEACRVYIKTDKTQVDYCIVRVAVSLRMGLIAVDLISVSSGGGSNVCIGSNVGNAEYPILGISWSVLR
ncbi:hypothetical protein FACUT_4251 [Fusarium acutatum]|uniref:Uncharacterized protein n=1 Tax=Fusarium acutatum TaxID=78861 RepID=A0A8H4JYJ1_9HYPO|nr:hypothetical protein FACUT_4251 [Fusarium acutatum]